jgi:TolB-like protein/Flp pilus assembly protein TadD
MALEDGEMGKVSIRLFGRLGVTDRDGGKISVAGKKPQALLAYLALNAGQPQSRNKLAALLWGERFDEQARQSLRQGISKLRKALGDGEPKVLVIDGDDVGLNTDATEIDAVEFERLASGDTPTELNEAAGFYVGGLLEGLEVKEKGFEDWIGMERARFGELAADVLAKLSRHQAATGDADAALETLRRLTAVDPLSEEGHRMLMRLYAGSGRRAQALKQYQMLMETLNRELGTEPDVETRKLFARIKDQDSSSPAPARESSAADAQSHHDKPAIAVLPFTNLSGDPEQEYFSDGITDDLITALSNVRAFFVIDRGSSFTFKGRAVDVKEVGRELGVHYVLEGSVRKAGDRVRVSAELIDATTGNHVWADRYDGGLDDIFDLQDEIAASVVGAIEPQIHRAEVERIRHKRPENFDAYDLTLSGLAKMNQLTSKDTAIALDLFMKAIALDPNYARAYVCASYCHRRQVQLKGLLLSDADKAEALRLAQAALNADRTDPYVLWQAGLTIGLLEGDLDEAAALIDRSLSINANANRAWLASAFIRCFLGDPASAIENAERAMRLSPLDVSMWVAHGVLAVAHMQLKDYKEAASWARKAVRLYRNNLPAHHVLVASLAQTGRQKEAEAALEELLDLDPGLTIGGLKKRYPISGYRNLDGFLEGLRKAGLKA